MEHYAARYRVTESEAAERLRLQPAISAMRRRAAAQHGQAFGGLWVDHGSGGRIKVAFTDDSARRRDEAVREFPRPEMVDSVHVSVGESSLVAKVREVADARQELTAEGFPDFDVWAEARNTAVVVSMAAPRPDDEERLRRRFGPLILVRKGIGEVTVTRETWELPLRGGIALRLPGCTVGFVGYRSPDYYLLSAGHCIDQIGESVQHANGVNLGTATHRSFGLRMDAMAARLVSSYNDSTSTSRWVYHTDTSRAYQIQATQLETEDYDDMYVCKAGKKTNLTCGPIVSRNYSPSYVPDSSDFRLAQMCVDGGDSGGPVYGSYIGMGIVSGRYGSTGCGTDPSLSVHLIYGHISFAQTAMGIKVRTN